jgi:hypothetical protein
MKKDNSVMLLEFELDVVGGNGYLNGSSWWFYGVCVAPVWIVFCVQLGVGLLGSD